MIEVDGGPGVAPVLDPSPATSPKSARAAPAATTRSSEVDEVASEGNWNAITPIAAASDATTVVPAADTAVVAGANRGTCDNHANGPAMRCNRPTETPRNARTISGSNCVPLLRVSS